MKYLLFTVIICIIYALTGAIASPIDNARSIVQTCMRPGQPCKTDEECCNKFCVSNRCIVDVI
ncbi:hypothetical protein C1645_839675 [Glomus cerebriforme]|uniref:Uncharacterized protein n=1 Tax=Glomus cerebriforme TaxID=658196 RepID=A0A397S0F2_9GLOM|nr:hypothetical protein C1645_839675 [Glomus cerebriforme]